MSGAAAEVLNVKFNFKSICKVGALLSKQPACRGSCTAGGESRLQVDSWSSWEKSELFECCRINHFHTECPTNAASFYSWDNEKVTSPRVCV